MTLISFDPRTGVALGGAETTSDPDLTRAIAASAAAAERVAGAPPAERRRWAASVAGALRAQSGELVALADAETGLGTERLAGEIERCSSAWEFYAGVAADGGYLEATIDGAGDGAPSIARVGTPIGPVAVFGASNFPFGFGVAGHDTASALAAGCPVLVKAHPAHPRLSERLGVLLASALAEAGAPDGAFALVAGFENGDRLVRAPEVAAVAFTGSQAGGLHLAEIARSRPVPIPVYAEMGTVNPVLVLPEAARRIGDVAAGFVASFTLGSGQFCTKPGLLLAPRGSGAPDAVRRELERAAPDPVMLTERIAASVEARLREAEATGASVFRVGGEGDGWRAPAAVVSARGADLVGGSPLLEEVFGAVAVVVEYDDLAGAEALIRWLQNHLAASVMADVDREPEALRAAVALLATRAGRVIVNGWPTGVVTGWAQHHGGGWPATTDPRATSVGAGALRRFVRPVAYQSTPDGALPEPLRAGNPWRIARRVDGVLEPAADR